jgi:hypothetical protein
MSGGEGASKSFTAGLWTTAMLQYLVGRNGLKQTPQGQIAVSDLCWVVGLTYEDAYKDWKYIYEFNEAIDNVTPGTYHVRDGGKDQCSFRTKFGQLVITLSGEDPEAVGRENVHVLVGAEASRWSSELFHRAQGRIERTANLGSGMFLSGSFKSSSGPFHDWYKLGQGPNIQGVTSYSVPSWENLALYPGGYDDPAMVRLRANNSEARFGERYGGKPAPPANAVVPEFNSILHVDPNLEWDDKADTYIGVDPGDICYAWLLWQYNEDRGEVLVQDEGYIHRGTHDTAIESCKLSTGWKHSQRTRRVFIDVAGEQHHANDSAADIWREGTGYWVTGERYKVETTVDRLRTLMRVNPATGRSRLRIHPRCKGLRAELGDGQNPIDGRGMWLRYSEFGRPRSDNCDAVKALGYSVQGVFGSNMPETNFDSGDETSFSYIGVHRKGNIAKPTWATAEGWKIV